MVFQSRSCRVHRHARFTCVWTGGGGLQVLPILVLRERPVEGHSQAHAHRRSPLRAYGQLVSCQRSRHCRLGSGRLQQHFRGGRLDWAGMACHRSQHSCVGLPLEAVLRRAALRLRIRPVRERQDGPARGRRPVPVPDFLQQRQLGILDESTVQKSGLPACCIGFNSYPQYSPSLGVAGLGSSINVLNMGDERTPHTWTYNVTVSQRVPWRSVAEFQYSGNKSLDMLVNGGNGGLGGLDLIPQGAFYGTDPITGKNNFTSPTAPGASGFPTQDYYPLHNYTGVFLETHGSYANYNAFIATWQKQSGRVTFTTNYTFSKVLGIRDGNSANGAQAGPVIHPFSPNANYGVLSWDHTHIFNAAYVINLPSPVKDNKFMGGVVNGWILSGITQAQSGAPIQPNTGETLNVGWPVQLQAPDYLGTNAFSTTQPAIICDPRSNLKSV